MEPLRGAPHPSPFEIPDDHVRLGASPTAALAFRESQVGSLRLVPEAFSRGATETVANATGRMDAETRRA
jgi:hypothetical protein